MEAHFEASELADWMQDLVNSEARVVTLGRPVVSKGALNVKNNARRLFEGQRSGGYLPHYSRSIGYDLTETSSGASAVIGPDSSMMQGGMGGAIEGGSVHHAPMPHLNPALDDEAPKFEVAAADVGVRALS